MRPALLGLILVVGCGSSGKDKDVQKGHVNDSGQDGTIAPPVACPVGDVLLTQAQFDRDLALLEAWNDIRKSSGNCGGEVVDATNALAVDEGLMWTARCWAYDVSLNGLPAQDETFSSGEAVEDVANGMGFVGIINGWGIQGGHPTAQDALQAWVDAGGDACTRLWADGSFGGVGVSNAGGTLVLTRLSGFGAP